MLYIFYGEDDFSREDAVREVKASLGDPGMLALNTNFLDGRLLTPGELLLHGQAVPFLASYRLVLVEGLLARFEARQERPRNGPRSSGEGGGQREWQAFPPSLQAMAPTTHVILLDGVLRRNNPLLRELAPLGQVREFRPLRGEALARWVRERVSRVGCSITPGAVRLLRELIGENLWILSSELEKLSLYTGSGQIGEEEVRALVGQAKDANIFSLVDAVALRQHATAAGLLRRSLEEGAAPAYILVMMARQFRFLLQALELNAAGRSQQEIGRALGLSVEWVLAKVLEQAQLYSHARLERLFPRLLETDLAIKTGRYDGGLALELLVAELCLGA